VAPTPLHLNGFIGDVRFALWSVVVYAPVAHWVFSPTGWTARLGALDFAGGTVVQPSRARLRSRW
jgi:ammonia channel protein AmtB